MKDKNKPNGKITVYLGKDTEFEGHLKFFGYTIVEGYFKGNISGEGNLKITKGCKIEADIHVSSIIVYGEIHGNVFAEEKIQINVPGKVFGKIEAPVLSIEPGAVFKGECHTRKPEFEEKDELEIESSLKLIDLNVRDKMDDAIEVSL